MVLYLFLVGVLMLAITGTIIQISRFNFKKAERYKQLPYVIFSMIYSVVMAFTFSLLLMIIDPFLSLKWITNIVLAGVPAKSYGAAFMLLIVLLSNAVFLWLETLVLNIAERCSRNGISYSSFFLTRKAEDISNYFYEFHDDAGEIYLKKERIAMVQWLNYIRKAILMLFFAMIIAAFVCIYIPAVIKGATLLKLLKSFFILIMASYIVVTEAFYYLDGFTKNEQATSFESDDVSSTRVGRYDSLLKLYVEKFGSAILNKDDYWLEKSQIENGLFNDTAEQMDRSKNRFAFETVINFAKISRRMLNSSYTEAILNLTEGRSIAVGDSIFGEFKAYLTAYLNYFLSSGAKAVIITGSKKREDKIANSLLHEFKKVNDINSIWRIGTYEQYCRNNGYDKGIDLLVCTSDDLIKIDENFFTMNIGCLVVDDPECTYTSSAVSKKLIHNKIGEISRVRKLQYIFLCNNITRNLEENIETTIGENISSYRNLISEKRTCVILWKKEPQEKLQYKLGIKGSYIGAEYPIALLAAKMGVSSIDVWCDEETPYVTYSEATNDNLDYLKLNLFQDASINLNTIVHVNDISSYEESGLKFQIVFDEHYNLIALVENWLKYGGSSESMIHVISKPYMLRDYLATNFSKLIMKPSDIKRIMPSNGCDVAKQCVILLLNLYESKHGKKSSDIIKMCDVFYGRSFGENSIEECLIEMLYTVLPEKKVYSIYDHFTFVKCEEFDKIAGQWKFNGYYNVKLIDKDIYINIHKKYNFLKLRFSGSGQWKTTGIHKEDVYNYYLPGQIHCFDGELYRINQIAADQVEVMKTAPKDVPEYSSIATYQVLKFQEKLLYTNHNKYSVSRIKADFDKTISGYYEFTDGIVFGINNESQIESYSEIFLPKSLRVERRDKYGIKLEMDIPCENPVRAEFLIVVMFNEIIKTLYPGNYKDLIVCSADTELYRKTISKISAEEQALIGFVPVLDFVTEVSSVRKPTIYVLEQSYQSKEILAGLEVKDHIQNIFDIMYEYLEWELAKDGQEGAYLKYGFDSYPQIFDTDAVITYLGEVKTSRKSVESADGIISQELMDGAERCPYCGRKIFAEHVETTDGKYMCEHCAKQIVVQMNEVNDLYHTAKKLIEKHYRVKLPKIRGFKFKGRDEIVKAAGDSAACGFYDLKKSEIWVEKYAPRVYMMSVIIHELTHSWQKQHLDMERCSLELLEGHATYVELEMLHALAEDSYARNTLEKLPYINNTEGNPYYQGYLLLKNEMKQYPNKNIFQVVKLLEESVIQSVSADE